ncbi:homeobox-leucine zipper protein ATHB-4-like isoform X1 [Glycine soja]|uniref:homeobox-leucine zipper protein ATHB-4-like isoform X1 n=1 Tax=Glycine soja TaxID=3848 RepID=UPI0010388B6D|nr:homeobox-leucine zipper protein ATHB-4-like isoform X1 [Glycine soja]
MGEKDDDFGLSLSLSLGRVNQQQQQPPPLNHMHQPQQLQTVPMNHNKTLFGDLSQLPADRSSEMIRGIDVNSAAECDGVSSPNSAVSSVSGGDGKQSERDDDNNAAAVAGERTSCSRGSDDDDGGGSDASRKKLRLTKEQSMVLEETFKEHSTLNPKRKQALAEELNLKPRQVEVWFQNRRARTKLKQTEVDCEYLKRCYENLTEENRRLHKEVQELRALKLSPQMYMHMNPPTTLTICPSCERTHSFASSSTATVHSAVAATSSNRKLFGTNIRLPVSFNTRPFEGPIPRP